MGLYKRAPPPKCGGAGIRDRISFFDDFFKRLIFTPMNTGHRSDVTGTSKDKRGYSCSSIHRMPVYSQFYGIRKQGRRKN